MNLPAFIKSPTGNLTVFAAFVVIGSFMIHRSNAREQARSAQMTQVQTANTPSLRKTIMREGVAFKPTGRTALVGNDAPPNSGSSDPADPARPRVARDSRVDKTPVKPRALPISLVAASTNTDAVALSKSYAPFGRLIPCETVITIESSKLDTPVIGLVTEDVWHNGQLIIPAGAEVHGRASLDRARERIAVSGKWVIVWRDASPLNGTELVLDGIALDRNKDDTTGEFGMRDGSAGLLGDLIKSDDWQEIKLFASTFLAGFAGGLQELRTQNTALGDLVQVPKASGRNAALQGTADVLNAYAKQIQEAIARDGFFVRVPAGKQFYLYVTETIDVAKGTRGNVANAEIWRKSHEN